MYGESKVKVRIIKSLETILQSVAGLEPGCGEERLGESMGESSRESIGASTRESIGASTRESIGER